METKHTQNLQIWGRQDKTEISGFYIVAADAPVAYVANRDDAVLFTHALQLLEALEMAMQIGDGCSRGFLGEFQKKASAVIALATGSEVVNG